MDPLTMILIGIGIWVFAEALQYGVGQTSATQPSSPLDSGVSMPAGTGKLSIASIAQLAANAGFSGNDLTTAVAIALAESGGDPTAVGDLTITPGGSVGLWQINLRWHPQYTAAMLADPQTNADAAYQIYQAAGNSFSPWSTFKSGVYMSFLDQASTYLTA